MKHFIELVLTWKKSELYFNHKTINHQQIRVHQQITNNTHTQEYTKISKINDKVNSMSDQLYINKTINYLSHRTYGH